MSAARDFRAQTPPPPPEQPLDPRVHAFALALAALVVADLDRHPVLPPLETSEKK